MDKSEIEKKIEEIKTERGNLEENEGGLRSERCKLEESIKDRLKEAYSKGYLDKMKCLVKHHPDVNYHKNNEKFEMNPLEFDVPLYLENTIEYDPEGGLNRGRDSPKHTIIFDNTKVLSIFWQRDSRCGSIDSYVPGVWEENFEKNYLFAVMNEELKRTNTLKENIKNQKEGLSKDWKNAKINFGIE